MLKHSVRFIIVMLTILVLLVLVVWCPNIDWEIKKKMVIFLDAHKIINSLLFWAGSFSILWLCSIAVISYSNGGRAVSFDCLEDGKYRLRGNFTFTGKDDEIIWIALVSGVKNKKHTDQYVFLNFNTCPKSEFHLKRMKNFQKIGKKMFSF